MSEFGRCEKCDGDCNACQLSKLSNVKKATAISFSGNIVVAIPRTDKSAQAKA